MRFPIDKNTPGKFNIVDLGKKDYKETWDLQKKIHQKRVDNELANTLLLVEHPPVVTMGKSGKPVNLLMNPQALEQKGIAYYEIERGGDVTFHGPGQIVGYPIFNVKEGLAGIKPFVYKMEDAIIDVLAAFNITGRKQEKMIGVWAEGKKICSIGIAVKRWVSFHGFALNVNTDLKYFDYIIPCGLDDVRMGSMEMILGKKMDMEAVKKKIIEQFSCVFGEEPVIKCSDEII